MYRHLALSILLVLPFFFGSCQSKIDLQKPWLAGDVRETYLKDKKRHADDRDAFTTLPAYYTHDVEGFTFGPVNFTHGGENGTDEETNLGNSGVYFLLNSIAERKQVGLYIEIQKSDEARKLFDYVRQTYGKGQLISHAQTRMKGNEVINGCFSYHDVQPGISMLLWFNSDDKKNDKAAATTYLFFIKDDAKPAKDVESFPTSLALLTASLSQ